MTNEEFKNFQELQPSSFLTPEEVPGFAAEQSVAAFGNFGDSAGAAMDEAARDEMPFELIANLDNQTKALFSKQRAVRKMDKRTQMLLALRSELAALPEKDLKSFDRAIYLAKNIRQLQARDVYTDEIEDDSDPDFSKDQLKRVQQEYYDRPGGLTVGAQVDLLNAGYMPQGNGYYVRIGDTDGKPVYRPVPLNWVDPLLNDPKYAKAEAEWREQEQARQQAEDEKNITTNIFAAAFGQSGGTDNSPYIAPVLQPGLPPTAAERHSLYSTVMVQKYLFQTQGRTHLDDDEAKDSAAMARLISDAGARYGMDFGDADPVKLTRSGWDAWGRFGETALDWFGTLSAYKAAVRLGQQMEYQERKKRGTLSYAEQKAFEYNEVDRMLDEAKGRSTTEKVAEGVLGSVRFAFEIAATGGMAEAARHALTKTALDAGGRYALARGIGRVLTEEAFRTIFYSGNIAANVMEETRDKAVLKAMKDGSLGVDWTDEDSLSVGQALLKHIGLQMGSLVTERGGSLLNHLPVGKAIAKYVNAPPEAKAKLGESVIAFAIGALSKKKGMGFLQQVQQVIRAGHFDGFFGEFFEEWMEKASQYAMTQVGKGLGAKGLASIDENSLLWNAAELKETGLTLGITSVGYALLGFAPNYRSLSAKRKLSQGVAAVANELHKNGKPASVSAAESALRWGMGHDIKLPVSAAELQEYLKLNPQVAAELELTPEEQKDLAEQAAIDGDWSLDAARVGARVTDAAARNYLLVDLVRDSDGIVKVNKLDEKNFNRRLFFQSGEGEEAKKNLQEALAENEEFYSELLTAFNVDGTVETNVDASGNGELNIKLAEINQQLDKAGMKNAKERKSNMILFEQLITRLALFTGRRRIDLLRERLFGGVQEAKAADVVARDVTSNAINEALRERDGWGATEEPTATTENAAPTTAESPENASATAPEASPTQDTSAPVQDTGEGATAPTVAPETPQSEKNANEPEAAPTIPAPTETAPTGAPEATPPTATAEAGQKKPQKREKRVMTAEEAKDYVKRLVKKNRERQAKKKKLDEKLPNGGVGVTEKVLEEKTRDRTGTLADEAAKDEEFTNEAVLEYFDVKGQHNVNYNDHYGVAARYLRLALKNVADQTRGKEVVTPLDRADNLIQAATKRAGFVSDGTISQNDFEAIAWRAYAKALASNKWDAEKKIITTKSGKELEFGTKDFNNLVGRWVLSELQKWSTPDARARNQLVAADASIKGKDSDDIGTVGASIEGEKEDRPDVDAMAREENEKLGIRKKVDVMLDIFKALGIDDPADRMLLEMFKGGEISFDDEGNLVADDAAMEKVQRFLPTMRLSEDNKRVVAAEMLRDLWAVYKSILNDAEDIVKRQDVAAGRERGTVRQLIYDLNVAKALLRRDVNDETIRSATGWAQDENGEWRYAGRLDTTPSLGVVVNGGLRRQSVGEDTVREAAEWWGSFSSISLYAGLDMAKRLEEEGKRPLAIKQATGWERVSDGTWRHELKNYPELSEKTQQLIASAKDANGAADWRVLVGKKMTLHDLVKADELFELLPELAKVEVSFESGVGSGVLGFVSNSRSMTLNVGAIAANTSETLPLPQYIRLVAIHEIQHLIQQAEGRPRGGSTDEAARGAYDAFDPLQQTTGEDLLAQDDEWKDLDDEVEHARRKYRAAVNSAHQKEGRVVSPETGKALNDLYEKMKKAIEARADRERELMDAEGQYLRLAGEVDSRNMQLRALFTPEQRNNSLMSDTESFKPALQIVLPAPSVSESGGMKLQAFPVYTGSAADYEQPSTDFVGTGEGAQAYGWGLYGSSSPNVARGYAKKDVKSKYGRGGLTVDERSVDRLGYDTILIDIISNAAGLPAGERRPVYAALDAIVHRVKQVPEISKRGVLLQIDMEAEEWSKLRAETEKSEKKFASAELMYIDKMLLALRAWKEYFENAEIKYVNTVGRHNLYKQTFWSGKNENLLDWDAPAPQKMQDAALRAIEKGVQKDRGAVGDDEIEDLIERGASPREILNAAIEAVQTDADEGLYHGPVPSGSGQELYLALAEVLQSPKAASEALYDEGVHGITYIGRASSVRNYVAFNGNDIRMDEHIRWQSDGGVENARGAYSPSTKVIYLLEKADSSTFPHETMHWFLDLLGQMEKEGALEGTPYLDDLRALREYATDKKTGEYNEEKITKAWEYYIAHGEVPPNASAEVAGALQTLKHLLSRIYQAMRNYFGDEFKLEPKVKEIFDSWLASDVQAKEQVVTYPLMQLLLGWRTAFNVPLEGQLDTKVGEGNVVGAMTADGKLELERNAQLLKNSIREYLDKQRADERKEYARAARREIEATVDESFPIYAFEANAKAEGGAIDREDIMRRKNGEELLKLLEGRGIPVAENGMTLAEAMNNADYDNVEQLTQDLTYAPSRSEFIDGETQNRVNDFDRDFDATGATILADETGKQLDMLLEALQQKLGKPVVKANRDAMRYAAVMRLGEMTVQRGMNMRSTEVAVRRNAVAVSRSMRNGKYGEAIKAIGRLYAAIELLREQRELRDKVQKTQRMANRIRRLKTVEGDFAYRAREIAKNCGLTRDAMKKLQEPTRSLQEMLRDAGAAEINTEVPEGNYHDMTVAEFYDVADLIGSLVGFAHDMAKEKRDSTANRVGAEAQEMIDHANSKDQKDKPVVKNAPGSAQDTSKTNKVRNSLSELRAATANLLSLVRKFDGGVNLMGRELGGPMERYVYNRLLDGYDLRMQLVAHAAAIAAPAFEYLRKRVAEIKIDESKLPPLSAQRKQYANEHWTAEMALACILYSGNADSLQKLCSGEEWDGKDGRPDPQAAIEMIRALFDRKKDWDNIQMLWNALDSMYPHVDRAFYNTTYQHLYKEPAAPFQVRAFDEETKQWGMIDIAGGYMPISYDGRLSRNHGGDFGNLRGDEKPDSYNIGASFVNLRKADTGRPITLSLAGFARHIDSTAHYAAFKELARDINLLMHNEAFHDTLKQKLGVQIDYFEDLLKNAIHQNTPDFGRLAEQARRIVVSASLWFNPHVLAMQFASALVGVKSIGPEYLKALWWFWTHWGAIKYINELSPGMKERQQGKDVDIRQEFDAMFKSKGQNTFEKLRNAGFQLIRFFDALAVYPLFYGMYLKKLKEGKSEHDAQQIAYKFISSTQGAGRAIDQSWVQSKWYGHFFLMFAGPTVAKGNTNLDILGNLDKVSTTDAVGTIIYNLVLPALFVSVVDAALSGALKDLGGGDPEKKNKAMERILLSGGLELLSALTETVPLLREMPQGMKLFGGNSTRSTIRTPVAATPDLAMRAWNNLTSGEWDKSTWQWAEFAGDLMRLPVPTVINRLRRYYGNNFGKEKNKRTRGAARRSRRGRRTR